MQISDVLTTKARKWPQNLWNIPQEVVLYPSSTSNHNNWVLPTKSRLVVLYLTSTSNHNSHLLPHHYLPPPFPTRPKQKRRRTPHAGQKQPRKSAKTATDYQYNRAPQNFPISVEKLSYKRIFTIIGESFSDHLWQFLRSPKKVWTPPKAAFSLLRTSAKCW